VLRVYCSKGTRTHVQSDARAPALLACSPDALVRAEARAPALLASAPLALVRAEASSLRLPVVTPRGALCCSSGPTEP